MKVISWLVVLAGIVFGCESRDSQEDSLEVSGQIAQVCTYKLKPNYDPALNPITNQIESYGRSFKDYCVWFKVVNRGKRVLLFDSIKTVWLFGDDFFAGNLAAAKGKKFIIPPGGNYLFSFSTDNYARKFFTRYGYETVSFCFVLTAVDNDSPHKVKTFGPFASDNFPPLVNLPACETSEIGAKLADVKYFPLRFFLARDDFIINNLKKFQKK